MPIAQKQGRVLAIQIVTWIAALSPFLYAADLPRPHATTPPVLQTKKSAGSRKANSARVALFENNDPEGAIRLARKELRRRPRSPEPWFVALQAASLSGDSAGELRSALGLCALDEHAGDPRLEIASAHLVALAKNTETFRVHLADVHRLAGSGNSACASGAREALFAAALDGLPGLDVRETAARAGYPTRWTLVAESNRAGAPLPAHAYSPEQLEFPDGRLRLPDYLPTSFNYSAETDYNAAEAGEYRIQIAGAKPASLSIDGTLASRDAFGGAQVRLQRGKHTFQIRLAGAQFPVSVRVDPVEAAGFARHAKFGLKEESLIAGELALLHGDLTKAATLFNVPALQETALAHWLLAGVDQTRESRIEQRLALRRALALAPASLGAEMRLAALEAVAGNNDLALPALQHLAERRPEDADLRLQLAKAASAAGLPLASGQAYATAVELHPSCSNLRQALDWFYSQGDALRVTGMEKQLLACAPGSHAFSEWLRDTNRHREAATALESLVKEWPLDRKARRELIAELQVSGDHESANRAAAEFVAVAPNTHTFRRLAGAAALPESLAKEPFYEPYRRAVPVSSAEIGDRTSPAVLLLQDKVAVARMDGSVSVYVHRVLQWRTPQAPDRVLLPLPPNAQLIAFNVLAPGLAPQPYSRDLESRMKSGDRLDQEFVVNYVGEGGMIGHPEAFQCVFHDFDYPLIESRFVVLTPIATSPGYIIASGQPPAARFEYHDGFRAEIWDKPADLAVDAAPAVIRVVENENGWSIPPSVERRKIIETIHPGPRPREA